ncbi:signal transducing adapter molecule 2 isoform X2 [Hydra vulgaris]|uniref:Signal transducing adapter molecule 2 isoform X2 n=1 Tax=Hydra vulgaris TaxID=6087 RepID=A0ABM4BRJ7_HYDVU
MPKSVLESEIEKATNECNISEDWQSYMDICDQIKAQPNGPKEALKYIMKRCSNPVPHVAMQALTLLATCVNNCGKSFHLEICSREWTNDAKNLITKSHEKVSFKLRELIKKWAEDFKNDPQLNLMCQFQKKLKADGLLSDSIEKPSKLPSISSSNELNFKEDLDLAIALSLQESNGSKQTSKSTTIYPTMSQALIPNQETKEVCRVLALYDFEAAEDNEMTFKAGEIFSVLDNSDQNWWKGCNNRGVGLFPANFVTTDLSALQKEQTEKKKVRFVEDSAVQVVKPDPKEVMKGRPQTNISQELLDLTLSMLKNASPNEIDEEEETISNMEMRCKEMGYAIEKKIIECQREKDDLNDLNSKFLQAISIYQQLMKEPMVTAQPSYQMQQSYSEAPYQQFVAPQIASVSNKVFPGQLKSDNFPQSEVERQQQALYTQQQRQQQQLIQQQYQERTLSNISQQYQALPRVYDTSQTSYVQTPTVYYDSINYQQPSNGYATYDGSYPVTSYNQTPVYH